MKYLQFCPCDKKKVNEVAKFLYLCTYSSASITKLAHPFVLHETLLVAIV